MHPVYQNPRSQHRTSSPLSNKIHSVYYWYLLILRFSFGFYYVGGTGNFSYPTKRPHNPNLGNIIWFLQYAATYPSTVIRYTKSDMIMYIPSDGSYLSEPRSRSRVGGLFYLSSKSSHPSNLPPQNPLINPSFHVVARILKMVNSSAMEANMAATFYNAKMVVLSG